MKTPCLTSRSRTARRRAGAEHGMATVIFIALLAIMMVLVLVESSAVIRLHREIKLLEQQQMKRLNAPAAQPATTNPNPQNER